MAPVSSAAAAASGSVEWLRVFSVAGITFGVLFVALLLGGLFLLFRRRGGRDQDAAAALATRANILLVRVDDQIAASEDELGFALAQFGDDAARSFAATLERAKAQLTEAFALQQRLDDGTPDSEIEKRSWTLRIIQLCDSAATDLADERARFDQLRRLERDAPRDLAELRRLIAQVTDRLPTGSATLQRLAAGYQPTAVGEVSGNRARAEVMLRDATQKADAAESDLQRNSASAVAETLRSAREAGMRANELLDAIERRASALESAAEQLQRQIGKARGDLGEARAVRDAPPDADTGASVAAAMTRVEGVLATLEAAAGPGDPMTDSVRLQHALDALDTALAGARNQQQRLERATEALAGALSIAESQLTTTRDLLGSGRSRIGVEARTRLAEADRQLLLARAEADPVVALDAARRSATLSRDADALARYDLMGGAVIRR